METVPHGGFVYDRNGQRVESFSRQGLIDALLQYRIDNRLAIGDPEKDVNDELSSRGGYSPKVSAGTTTHQAKAITFLDRIRSWLGNRYSKKDSLKYVTANEARRRALICARCVANREWRNACTPCIQNVERDVVILSQNRRVIDHVNLLGCLVAGHENRVAIWLDSPHPSVRMKAFRSKLPKVCWMR